MSPVWVLMAWDVPRPDAVRSMVGDADGFLKVFRLSQGDRVVVDRYRWSAENGWRMTYTNDLHPG